MGTDFLGSCQNSLIACFVKDLHVVGQKWLEKIENGCLSVAIYFYPVYVQYFMFVNCYIYQYLLVTYNVKNKYTLVTLLSKNFFIWSGLCRKNDRICTLTSSFLIEFVWALYCFLDFTERDLHCGNADCKYPLQACTNFM